MVIHETNIDTVTLQLDFDNTKVQRDKLSLLQQWITIRNLGLLESDCNSSSHVVKYNVYYAGTILFTIHSGSTRIKDKLTNELVNQYYIRIRFAGLKSHKQRQDKASYDALMTICAWLNTTRTNFRLVELDVAIDVNCSFYNVLAVCINKSANVLYNPLNSIQYYDSIPTTYIEDYKKEEQRKDAVLRAYLYNKSAKEGLDFVVTRFELKLQNRFFLKNEFDTNSIINALDRYCVMYFANEIEKERKICEYNKYKIVTTREIDRLGFRSYRLYPNPAVIKEFMRQIKSVYVGFYWDIVIPLASPNYKNHFFKKN